MRCVKCLVPDEFSLDGVQIINERPIEPIDIEEGVYMDGYGNWSYIKPLNSYVSLKVPTVGWPEDYVDLMGSFLDSHMPYDIVFNENLIKSDSSLFLCGFQYSSQDLERFFDGCTLENYKEYIFPGERRDAAKQGINEHT